MFTSARLSSETLALAFRCRVSVSVEPTRKMTTDVVLPLSVLASTTVPEAQCHSPQATLHDAATQAQASTLTFHTENLLLSAGHWPPAQPKLPPSMTWTTDRPSRHGYRGLE